jgi:hypothetical protein
VIGPRHQVHLPRSQPEWIVRDPIFQDRQDENVAGIGFLGDSTLPLQDPIVFLPRHAMMVLCLLPSEWILVF